MMSNKKLINYEEVYGTMTTTGGSFVWFGVYTGKHDWREDYDAKMDGGNE